MQLSHFSDHKILEFYSVPQDREGAGFGKPRGLWVSVDGEDDWPAWCKAEQFRDTDKQNHYRVNLAETHGCLVLTTADEVFDFGVKYGKPTSEPYARGYIDWARVAREYNGLIIAPYQWPARLDERSFWYYGWDCASGCIWGAAAVQSIELLREKIKARPVRRRLALAE